MRLKLMHILRFSPNMKYIAPIWYKAINEQGIARKTGTWKSSNPILLNHHLIFSIKNLFEGWMALSILKISGFYINLKITVIRLSLITPNKALFNFKLLDINL
jgi:hypothetical protein